MLIPGFALSPFFLILKEICYIHKAQTSSTVPVVFPPIHKLRPCYNSLRKNKTTDFSNIFAIQMDIFCCD